MEPLVSQKVDAVTKNCGPNSLVSKSAANSSKPVFKTRYFVKTEENVKNPLLSAKEREPLKTTKSRHFHEISVFLLLV